jgi:hypothetical protein
MDFMSWKTIYITGRKGFCEDVVRQLERSSIDFMPGYNTGEEQGSYGMFWVPETLPLSEVKRAIGAKTVLRYRLHFYTALEEFMNDGKSLEFTKEDKEKIEKMRLHDAA